MTTLRLLADDLTGALDTAAELVGHAGPVKVFWDGNLPGLLPPSAALDSGTREGGAAAAAATAARLGALLPGAGIAFKKVDSLLRGHTLAEIVACLRAGGWARAVFAPAFPYQGRVTRGGVQHVRAGSGWAATGGDLVAALRAAGIAAQPGRPGADLPPGVSVFDAETDAELQAAVAAGRRAPGEVLWIGSGGLAQAMGHQAMGHRAMGGPQPPPLPAPALPLLGLFGSDHGATAAQLAACGPLWTRLADTGDEAGRVGAALRQRGAVLASLDLPEGLPRPDAARRIAASFAALVAALPPPATLVVSGGETLRALCTALGAASLEVRGRRVPGLPQAILRGGAWDGVTVIAKSGAFGPPTLLRELVRQAQAGAARSTR